MTDKQKASAVLNYLEGVDSRTVINILSPYATDEQLAALYDKLTEEGIFNENDQPGGYSEDFLAGMNYVLEQMCEEDKAIIRAEVSKAYSQHLVPNGDIVDDSRITDLLEEYGQDHDLPEGWYLDEYDASEILLLV